MATPRRASWTRRTTSGERSSGSCNGARLRSGRRPRPSTIGLSGNVGPSRSSRARPLISDRKKLRPPDHAGGLFRSWAPGPLDRAAAFSGGLPRGGPVNGWLGGRNHHPDPVGGRREIRPERRGRRLRRPALVTTRRAWARALHRLLFARSRAFACCWVRFSRVSGAGRLPHLGQSFPVVEATLGRHHPHAQATMRRGLHRRAITRTLRHIGDGSRRRSPARQAAPAYRAGRPPPTPRRT